MLLLGCRWIVILILCALAARAAASSSTVVWIERVNVTVSGDVLQKTAGCDGCFDAAAVSEQRIAAGDGYVEFTIAAANTLFIAGLNHGNDGVDYTDIDFAFRFNGAGHADVLLDGVYAGGDTSYAAGDVFRIGVVAGTVLFSRNGTVLMQRVTALSYPLLLDTAVASLGNTLRAASIGSSAAPGGFVEKAGSPTVRARLTPSQMTSMLPAGGAPGRFTFPAPYHTEAVRLTGAADCADGQDCVSPVGYSYWRSINNHVASNTMHIVLGFDRTRGGAGPSLIAYDKFAEEVQNLGPLFPENSPYSYSTTEGWYFSAIVPTRLYAFLPGGTTLRRFDVVTRQFDALPALDLSACPRPSVCPAEAAFITQPHSSDDDRVHSATVQNAAFERLGCVAFDSTSFLYFPVRAGAALDECHVDKSGRWLLILETQADEKLDNRVADLLTGTEIALTDVAGALGHLDTGFGYAIGADNYNALPNASILLKFPVTRTARPLGPVVHFNKRWDIAAANHIAHGNATPGRTPEQQYACGSNASRVADTADEIVCFSLNANRYSDGSLDVLVVGQVLTDLDAAGGNDFDGDDYEQVPKGNLDVTGRYFIWTANLGGDRLDAFLVKVPAEVLGAIVVDPGTVTALALTPDRASPSPAGTTVTWTATPTGGRAPHQYKWWLFEGGAWRIARDWTASNTFAWTPAATGAYRVGVWVRSAGEVVDAAEFPHSVPYTVTVGAVPVVSSVALAADRTSPQLTGTTINWTATPTGGTAPYQYKWWLFNGASWSAVTGWTASGALTWTPSTAHAAYSFRVWVRSAGNAADAPEAHATSPNFAIVAPAPPPAPPPSSRVTAVTLTPDRASPQAAGTAITWTATPTGGAAPHQYKWWVYNGVSWSVARDWDVGNTLAWRPSAAGQHYVGVWVRSAGNAVDAAEFPYSVPFTITAGAVPVAPVVSSVALAADRTPPQPTGTTINWTATPTGGTAPYQYKWWLFNGASWSAVTGWTASGAFAWTPAIAHAAYSVRVWVRSAGNGADAAEALATSPNFAIVAPAPPPPPSSRVTAVSLTPSRVSPQAAGTTITWTATPVGGTAPHQYKWWIYSGGLWTIAQDWTTSNTLAWTPSSPGPHYVGVWVRSAGNPADAAEVPYSVAFIIQ